MKKQFACIKEGYQNIESADACSPHQENGPTPVLLVIVHRKQVNLLITHDIFFKIFSAFGEVLRILIFERQVVWKAFVEIDSIKNAMLAREQLNATTPNEIGSKINVYYSNLNTIIFEENNSAGVDYTILKKKIEQKKWAKISQEDYPEQFITSFSAGFTQNEKTQSEAAGDEFTNRVIYPFSPIIKTPATADTARIFQSVWQGSLGNKEMNVYNNDNSDSKKHLFGNNREALQEPEMPENISLEMESSKNLIKSPEKEVFSSELTSCESLITRRGSDKFFAESQSETTVDLETKDQLESEELDPEEKKKAMIKLFVHEKKPFTASLQNLTPLSAATVAEQAQDSQQQQTELEKDDNDEDVMSLRSSSDECAHENFDQDIETIECFNPAQKVSFSSNRMESSQSLGTDNYRDIQNIWPENNSQSNSFVPTKVRSLQTLEENFAQSINIQETEYEPGEPNLNIYDDVTETSDPSSYVNPLFIKATRKSKVLYARWFKKEQVNMTMLYNIFSTFGNIERMIFLKERLSVLIQYENVEYAALAKDYLNETMFLGENIKTFYSNYEEVYVKPPNNNQTRVNENEEEYFVGDPSTHRFHSLNGTGQINYQAIVPPCDTLYVCGLRNDVCNIDLLNHCFSSYGSVITIKRYTIQKQFVLDEIEETRICTSCLGKTSRFEALEQHPNNYFFKNKDLSFEKKQDYCCFKKSNNHSSRVFEFEMDQNALIF